MRHDGVDRRGHLRRGILVSIVLFLSLAGLAVWHAPARSSPESDSHGGESAFGPRVAGTYLLKVQHVGFPLALALVTLTRDGGFIANDTSDHGAGGLVTRDGPVQGAWKRIDDRRVIARTLYFAYDPAGTGIPKWIARTTGEFEFDRGFQSGQGTLRVERFELDQDPLDPNEIPHDTLDATFSARRVTAD